MKGGILKYKAKTKENKWVKGSCIRMKENKKDVFYIVMLNGKKYEVDPKTICKIVYIDKKFEVYENDCFNVHGDDPVRILSYFQYSKDNGVLFLFQHENNKTYWENSRITSKSFTRDVFAGKFFKKQDFLGNLHDGYKSIIGTNNENRTS